MVAVGGKARAKGRTRLDRHTSSGWADHFDATLGYPGEGPETPGRPPPAEATDEEADLEEETQALVADPDSPSRLDPKEPACRPCQQCQRPCLSEAGHRARVGSTDLQAILPVPETARIARPLETSSHVQRSGPS